MIRDIGIGVGIIITTILCPPLGAAAAVIYGAVQIKSGIDGEDWGTHRKLSQEERVGNIIFGGLDAIPVVGAVGKGVKAFKDTSELADLAKLLKFKEGMPGFNPNLGKNVVQSLRDNKAIMLDRLKLTSLKMEKSGNEKMYQLGEKIAKSIDDRTVKSASFEVDGNGLLISKQGGTDFQSWVNKHHTESNKIIDDKIKGVEASLASKGTGNREAEVPPAFRQTDFASSYEARYNQTPSPINSKVEFEGIRGESLSTLKPPPDPKLKRILDEAGIKGIQYKNGVPDFSPVSKAQIEIDYMLGGKGNYGTKARTYNFAQADQKLADKLNDSVELARQFGMEPGGITAKDIDKYRTKNQLTWHEVNDVKIMQLVPTEINKRFGHLGGVGEINAGAFEPGGFAKK